MKKLSAVLALCLFTPSCSIICDTACDGTGMVKGVVADGLGFIPVIGPVAGSITDVAFEALCTGICLPRELGDGVEDAIGVSLDPTSGEEDGL